MGDTWSHFRGHCPLCEPRNKASVDFHECLPWPAAICHTSNSRRHHNINHCHGRYFSDSYPFLLRVILHTQNDFPQLKYALPGGMGLLAPFSGSKIVLLCNTRYHTCTRDEYRILLYSRKEACLRAFIARLARGTRELPNSRATYYLFEHEVLLCTSGG